MSDDHGGTQRRSDVRSAGDRNTIHAGTGDQNVTYHGPSMRTVLAGLALAALVAGLVLVPEASTGQHLVYWLLLCVCGGVTVLALWFGFDSARRALRPFVRLLAAVVLCLGLACGGYVSLRAHGDLSVPTTPREKGPLENKDGVTHTFDVAEGAPITRSRLRVTVDLRDARPEFGTCVTSGRVTLVPVLNDSPDAGAGIELGDGETGDIRLPDARGRLALQAHVRSTTPDEMCRLYLSFDSAVLHDDTWWLP